MNYLIFSGLLLRIEAGVALRCGNVHSNWNIQEKGREAARISVLYHETVEELGNS